LEAHLAGCDCANLVRALVRTLGLHSKHSAAELFGGSKLMGVFTKLGPFLRTTDFTAQLEPCHRRLAGFEQESALCFYDDEEEEMQVSFVVHELHRCT